MKAKYLIAALFMAVACLACQNKRCAADIRTTADTLNYMYGVANGRGILEYKIGADSADSKKMEAFSDGFRETFGAEGRDLIRVNGIRVGAYLGEQIKSGFLFNDSTIKVDRKLIKKGFECALSGEVTGDESEAAYRYVERVMAASMSTGKPACPTAKAVDSLNLCTGMLNGRQARYYALGRDTSDQAIKAFFKGFKHGFDMKQDSVSIMELRGLEVAMKFTQLFAAADTTKDGKRGLLGDTSVLVNFDAIGRGVLDVINHNPKQLVTYEEAEARLSRERDAIKERKFGDNKRAGEQFLAENGKREGVITTASGLQYEVIKEGRGEQPRDSAHVKMESVITLIDGTEIVNSIKRNHPVSAHLENILPGWREGVMLMHTGSKYKLYLPYDLAYGTKDMKNLGVRPFSAIIIEVELLSIEKQ